jgi:hypothetical protein
MLFLDVALGDNATWSTECHSREQSRRTRLLKTPFFFIPAPPKERAGRVVTNPALTAALIEGHRGRGLEDNVCRVAPLLFSQHIARMLSRVRKLAWQADQRTCRFHSSLPSNGDSSTPSQLQPQETTDHRKQQKDRQDNTAKQQIKTSQR